MDFASILKRTATTCPTSLAAVCGADRLTFGQLFDRSSRLANALIGMGLQAGDRVAVLGDNSVFSLEHICAIAQAGLVRCPMYTQNTGDVHAYMLNLVGARCLVVQGRYFDVVEPVLHETPVERVVVFDAEDDEYEDLLAASSAEFPTAPVDEDDNHIIRFSAGTTGRPKGIVHSNRGWLQMGNEFVLSLPRIEDDDVQFVAGPLSHAAGLFVWPTIAAGAAHALLPSFDPVSFFQLVESERASFGVLVPTMIQALVNHPEATSFDLTSLRAVFYGAAPIAEQTLVQAQQLWGNIMYQVYGQSETLPISCLSPRYHVAGTNGSGRSLLRSAGRPTPNTLVKVVDDDGKELAPGEVGEIAVRSPGAMKEIWQNPEATAERMLPDGFVLTRDVGCVAEDGFVFIEDRKEDLIISGGFNIWPAEIENALFSHPAVLEAAVVGVPHPKWGETPLAVVVLRDGSSATEAELVDWCRDRVGSVKKPTRVEFRTDPLPKSGPGKVLRRELRDQFWAGHDRRVAGS